MSRLSDILVAPLRLVFCSPLFTSTQHRLGMSLPLRTGILTLLLLLIVTVAVLVFQVGLRKVSPAAKAHPVPFSVTGLLLLTVPLLTGYVASRFETEVECEFPELEQAWREGLRALRVKGISLTQTPLFLVVGPRDADEARAVVESSELDFEVRGLPFDNSPLIWFASQDVIFLVCPGASQVGLLSLSALGEFVAADNAMGPISEKSIFDKTVGAVMDFLAASNELSSSDAGQEFHLPLQPDTADSASGQQLYDVSNPGYHLLDQAAKASSAARKDSRLSLDLQSLAIATRKLQTVCRLLKQKREPWPALNGILSFMPATLISASDHSASALQSAVAFDNDVICRNIGLRAHQVIMVGGMEQETGFRELVRRFGSEVSRRNRIGKGNPQPWCDPTAESLEALARHACAAFEDNVYPLFAKDHELREPGNPKLYKLLCVSRQRLTNRLARILRSGYSYERDFERSLPVLGCYFAATGHRRDRQAFTSSVFRKLMQHQDLLDWHPALRRSHERFLSLTNLLLAVNLILIGVLVVIFLRG